MEFAIGPNLMGEVVGLFEHLVYLFVLDVRAAPIYFERELSILAVEEGRSEGQIGLPVAAAELREGVVHSERSASTQT